MYPPQRKFQPSRRFAPRRRNRLTIICAVVITLMLLLFLRNSWEDPYSYPPIGYTDKRPSEGSAGDAVADDAVVVERPKPAPVVPDLKPEPKPDTPALTDEKLEEYNIQKEEEDYGIKKPDLDTQEVDQGATSPAENTETEVQQEDADTPAAGGDKEELESPSATDEALELHSQSPPNDGTSKAIVDEPNVHWKPVPEHFPVPEDEIAHLPTGTPKKIPKIQYDFATESEEARTTRQSRLKRVKDEIERAWGGYKRFAWMHDELSPVSAKYRDPFCGWAATLVDSLDTLWIAGLKEDFDRAAKAVKEIDFTITERNEIPVFETTIRYLGGLLAAFDVSGGHDGGYDVLLEKAVELAEILMGIFDTPNRMPVLYYNWKPEHASQPHRASRVGVAELATLTMEFTRLAQLTKENKYYDAVNRITDALVEMQEAGRSQVPGLFPENIDASGCNKTAMTLQTALSKAAQKQLESPDALVEPEGYAPSSSLSSDEETSGTDALASRDVNDEPSVVQHYKRDTEELVEEVEESMSLDRAQVFGNEEASKASSGSVSVESDDTASDTEAEGTSPWDGIVEEATDPPFAADGTQSKWECVPQGLTPSGYGTGSFHMGGGQDSAYEYFPKEWLLLGGLEPKYQKLYEDSVEAINDWLLYRPMIDGDWDILFPAKVSVSSQAGEGFDPKYEVTHLTCFIGGMYGLGGKIFGREQDVETAKKLTDGCVWAYESMPSGLMPEHSYVAPCPSLDKCEFNETQWWEQLDPARLWREREIAKWDAFEAEKQASLEKADTGAHKPHDHTEPVSTGGDTHVVEDLDAPLTTAGEAGGSKADDLAPLELAVGDDTTLSSGSLRKRAAVPVEEKKTTSSGTDDEVGSELPDSLKKKLGLDIEDTKEKPKEVDVQTVDETPGIIDETPGIIDETPGIIDETPGIVDESPGIIPDEETETTEGESADKPTIPKGLGPGRIQPQRERPIEHEAFVKQRIEDQGLKPGFVGITARHYILRYAHSLFSPPFYVGQS